MREEILTFCPLCAGHCAAKATVEDGKIVKWERDRESGIPSEMCPPLKGRSNMEISTHPDRLKHPLKRTGARGEGRWQRVSWDEALDAIAEKLIEIKEQHGPEAFGVGLGLPKGLEFAFGQRLASAFGTPNVATPSHLCAASKIAGVLSEEFPLLLTTRLEEAYKLTGFKQIASGRKRKPEPTIERNPDTAKELGLKQGEWVNIETKNGRIKQKLDLDKDLNPKVVYASFGWWFPEEPSNLYAWDRSNVNILFDTKSEEPATGTVEVRGIPCRVSRIGD
jgi:anaerobic selenocysteine-containing dehydrogenase